MDGSILIQGLALAGVVTAMILDFRADERGARTGHAKARTAGPEQRCPFCHQGFEADEVKVRCASCASGHHAACWSEHPRCSIFGITARAANTWAIDIVPTSAAMTNLWFIYIKCIKQIIIKIRLKLRN